MGSLFAQRLLSFLEDCQREYYQAHRDSQVDNDSHKLGRADLPLRTG
jgi:hypothetical protein